MRTTVPSPSRPAAVMLPGDPGWDEAREAWNALADQHPAAIAEPTSAAEVVDAVRWARAAHLRVAPQSTGHASLPLGDLSDSLLLKTRGLAEVAIDPARRIARAGGGAVWEQVVEAAAGHGLAVLHGSSPGVGVAGYSLGGGMGWLARLHGLACNSLTAVELVTADGDFVRADAEHEPDLFWALRGGGGNFGVVTALEFRTYPLESVYAGWLIFPWERSDEVLKAWSRWTLGVPDEVTSVGRILQLPDIPLVPEPLRGADIVVVEAAYAGDEETGIELLRPLRDLGPMMDTFAQVPPTGLMRLHADPEGRTPGSGDHAILDSLPDEAVDAFVAAAGPGSGSSLISAELRHMGGALGRPLPGSGALSHVDGAYIMFAVGLAMSAEMLTAITADVERVVASVAPFGRGRSYLNFAESPADTRTAFSQSAHQRLQEIKALYDAGGVSRSNHPLRADA